MTCIDSQHNGTCDSHTDFKVKSQSHGAGAYCGGHLAAQLVINIITIIYLAPVIAREARVSGQAYYDICCNVCTIAKLRENGYVHRYDCNETVRTAAGGVSRPAYWAPASLIRPTPKKTPVA